MNVKKLSWPLTACLLLGMACRAAEASNEAPPPPQAPAIPEKLEPTLMEQLAEETTLPGALKVIGPHFDDATDDLDPGALKFALWSASHLKWQDIQQLPETKHAKVLKDPDAERGKRNCYRGKIAQIQVDRSAGTPVYLGGLVTGGGTVLRFAAVGSTGELVEDSYANFCGVTTGKYSYSNAGGGTTHAVFLVGLFDLPENKPQANKT
jgi:hypothetical protein